MNQLSLSLWSGYYSILGGSQCTTASLFCGRPDHVGSHSSGGTSTRRAPCREESHRPRMIFVSIVARSCRRFQRWNLDRQITLSRELLLSTNDLRLSSWPDHVGSHSSGGIHRGQIMSEVPAVEPRPTGHLVERALIVYERSVCIVA